MVANTRQSDLGFAADLFKAADKMRGRGALRIGGEELASYDALSQNQSTVDM